MILGRREAAATTDEIGAAAGQGVSNVSCRRTLRLGTQWRFDEAIADTRAISQRLVESFGVEVEEGPDRWTPGMRACAIVAP